MKYFPGSVFLNMSLSSISSCLAPPAYALMQKGFNMNMKQILSIFFIITVMGSLPLIYTSSVSSAFYLDYVVPASILVLSFGYCGAFMSLFLGHFDLFPVVFSTTTLGICNVFARFATVGAPLIAEIPEPLPQNLLLVLSIIAMATSFFVQEKTKSFY